MENRATTEPHRIAFPTGVMSPSQRPNVPSPEAKAACRSDQVEVKPDSESRVTQKGESCGATASKPASRSNPTTWVLSLTLNSSPYFLDRTHRSEP